MKTLINVFVGIFAVLMLQSCIASRRPNIDFFKQSGYDYKGAKFASFNVPLFLAKPFIKKALREDGESEEVIALIKKVSKIRVMTVDNGSKAMLNDYSKYLNDNDFEDWATIKHDGENVNVRVKQNGETIKNMMITVNSDKELVFVDVRGNFTADDISKVINAATDK
ncbi:MULTISPECIES: DUF4252 domain-containing protein [Chryseobacterium]|uniref:DUF4252 domain-containing protein n=1 Tax=Chryseobacterium herbae TaxID=2976476 RepID=A0ABT2ITX8_9FLAO|nr:MULTISPECIES: DUF4252 domain-containing protein [unclassified Chryseobacterium]KFF15881.1 hypothetical protein IW22_23490 [Chryseobacterium sp. JM1]MCT2562267.1 DUF4252 domain-containing protein [Chryseobacterium sp. pc1-10]